jgi:ClpP class serine protease
MLEQDGVKVTLISAGKFKTEGNPFEPLSDEAREAFQADIDAFYAMFTNDVAKGRGASADDVRSGFGEGRMVMARDAVKAGMADRVATFDETVARLARGDVPASRARAQADTEMSEAVADRLESLRASEEKLDNDIAALEQQNDSEDIPSSASQVDPAEAASRSWVRDLHRELHAQA